MKFLGFMWNPLSWVMEIAAIMAIALANGGVSKRLLYLDLFLPQRYSYEDSHELNTCREGHRTGKTLWELLVF